MEPITMMYSVGRPKHDKVMITANEQDLFIGEVTVTLSVVDPSIGKVQRCIEIELSNRAWHHH